MIRRVTASRRVTVGEYGRYTGGVAPGVSQAGRTALAPSVWVGGSGHSLSVLSYYRQQH